MGKTKKGPKKGASETKKKTQPQKVLNPFEVHVNRQKFQILGRKTKADRGLPGVARAKALKIRKATLLQEYKLKDKSNKFVDRRIGERNSAMTAEDKMTARFAAERMRAESKRTMFNLADDEVLTHRGQTLNEIEKFDDPRSDDEDDEDNPLRSKGNLDAHFVREAHFGGGLFTRAQDDGSNSRKDLIDQLISESKKKKAEQQKLREETIDLTEKLDSEWRDLLPVINASPKASDVVVERPKPDSYDVVMRELKFEATGKPSDKLKSEDDVAREEKKKLEELEAARLRRMQGISDTPADVPNHRSADDLDDNFAIDMDSEHSYNGEEMEHGSESAGSDQEDDNEDEDSDGEDDEDGGDINNTANADGNDSNGSDAESNGNDANSNESDGESDESDKDSLNDLKYDSSDEENTLAPEDGEDGGDEEKEVRSKKITIDQKQSITSGKNCNNGLEQVADKAAAIREDLKKRKQLMEAARRELPYTFEVPECYEELQKVLAGRSPDFQGVIVERMIKCTHPSLSSDNKEKLAYLFTLLMQHLHDSAAADENENVCWEVLDRLAPSLFDITQWCPEQSAQCIKHVLQEKQQEYQNKKRKFPGVDTLIFMKLISLLFPTSDFRHPVVTPALVFMGQMLSKCRLESRQDVAKGLLLVSLFLEYTVLSKRFSPEAVNFLRNVLFLATTLPSTQTVAGLGRLPRVRPVPPVTIIPPPRILLQPNDSKKTCRVEPNDRLKACDLIGTESVDDMFCVTSVWVSLRMLSSMAMQLSSQPACRYIFSPIIPLLESLSGEKWLPNKVKEEIEKLKKSLLSISETPLKYLVAAPQRPKPLKLHEPKLEEIFADGKQHRPVSREKQERQKLLHKIKREKKGALREIRRDRDFLAKIKLKQQMKSDAERMAKVKEIFGEASAQQGELRKLFSKKKK